MPGRRTCTGPQVPNGEATIWSSVMRCAGLMVSMPSRRATSGAESGLGRLCIAKMAATVERPACCACRAITKRGS